MRSYLGGTDSGWFSGFHPWVGYGYESFGARASMPVSGFFADNSHTVTIEPVVH